MTLLIPIIKIGGHQMNLVRKGPQLCFGHVNIHMIHMKSGVFLLILK